MYIKGGMSICVNTHCLMLEVLRYISYITLNALIVYMQRSKQCQRCQRYATDFNALIAMYAEDIEDGVCSFYATLHTELLILLLMLKVSKVSNTMNN